MGLQDRTERQTMSPWGLHRLQAGAMDQKTSLLSGTTGRHPHKAVDAQMARTFSADDVCLPGVAWGSVQSARRSFY